MIRTQIYLPISQITQLRTVAHKKRTTVSDLVRILIGQGLRASETLRSQKRKSTLFDVLDDIKRSGQKGPSDLAQNMDKYYYGNI